MSSAVISVRRLALQGLAVVFIGITLAYAAVWMYSVRWQPAGSLGLQFADGSLEIVHIDPGGPAAVAGMTVPLHPIAVAGYISLVVNALSILPVGTTDGGRAAITMFGRPLKSFVGSMALFGLLLVGLGGSDLFLFYFGFCIAFQSGNDVPMRNEVDSLDIPRVFFATVVYIVAALALIPFQ